MTGVSLTRAQRRALTFLAEGCWFSHYGLTDWYKRHYVYPGRQALVTWRVVEQLRVSGWMVWTNGNSKITEAGRAALGREHG